MKSFVVNLKESNNHILTDLLLQQHIAYLIKLKADGYLVVCGPFCDNQNAIVILRAKDAAFIKSLIESDPFIINSYYSTYEISEFREANEQNNWLV